MMRISIGFCCVLVAALAGCKMPGTHNLPPAERLMHPGPGVDGPGPGVLIPEVDFGAPGPMAGATSQIAFVGPDGMMINWDVSEAGMFDSEPLVVPGSQTVRKQLIDAGYDKVFEQHGFEFREAGCSMCLAMNPDKLVGRELCASSSNRNFKRRQGSPVGRTLLMSPVMVAAAAIDGAVADALEVFSIQ